MSHLSSFFFASTSQRIEKYLHRIPYPSTFPYSKVLVRFLLILKEQFTYISQFEEESKLVSKIIVANWQTIRTITIINADTPGKKIHLKEVIDLET
jgi:hypothetical protein